MSGLLFKPRSLAGESCRRPDSNLKREPRLFLSSNCFQLFIRAKASLLLLRRRRQPCGWSAAFPFETYFTAAMVFVRVNNK